MERIKKWFEGIRLRKDRICESEWKWMEMRWKIMIVWINHPRDNLIKVWIYFNIFRIFYQTTKIEYSEIFQKRYVLVLEKIQIGNCTNSKVISNFWLKLQNLKSLQLCVSEKNSSNKKKINDSKNYQFVVLQLQTWSKYEFYKTK